MADITQGALISTTLCWRLERRDGICLGFTAHDRDLILDGLLYRAAPGILPSAVTLSDGFDADGLEIAGALTSGAIREEDLAAGRWDGASVFLFLVDWRTPAYGSIAIARGVLGEVRVTGAAFEAELKGPTALLDGAAAEQISPECRAALGDKRCRVDMAGRVRTARVAAAPEADAILLDAPAGPDFALGRLRWLTGRNSGLSGAIRAADGTRIVLREPPPFTPAAGDRVEIMQGCDKALATCAGRFGNAANFRGEPHLPGIDLLTRYPGA